MHFYISPTYLDASNNKPIGNCICELPLIHKLALDLGSS